MSGRVFLSAEWRHLLNFTFAVDPVLLEPHLPRGCSLVLRQGHAFASVVAFDFLDTRVLGLRVPFHVNFSELNLRFYVESKNPRGESCVGVVFIREFVPRLAVAWAARFGYNEPYRAIPMRSQVERAGGHWRVRHEFGPGYRERIELSATDAPRVPPADSDEHFFKEHEWGFGRDRRGETLVYRVEHPVWEIYPVLDTKLDVDFARLYGPEWGFLNEVRPELVVFAEGSPIKVFFPDRGR